MVYTLIMNTEEYRKKVEEEILKILEEKLKAGQMNAERAREIARYILNALHPNMSFDQIYTVVQNFDDHFPELIGAVTPVVNHYEDTVKKIVSDHAGKLMKQGKVTEATELIQKAINKQVKLGK